MLSRSLHRILIVTIVVFILHGIEEYFTGFYDADRSFLIAMNTLGLAQHATAFVVYQLLFWSLLIVSYILIKRQIAETFLLLFVGVLFFVEPTHAIDAVRVGGYFPGLYTAFLLYVVGVLYWIALWQAKSLSKTRMQT